MGGGVLPKNWRRIKAVCFFIPSSKLIGSGPILYKNLKSRQDAQHQGPVKPSAYIAGVCSVRGLV